ncbi:uncharacterized protein LOC131068897 isoform X2 [Cryptomeria japonica]|uniref:uncharacterized protein LOC131068897 isoform X2 n=1 Tax=Cryptomeria japonica TaxID=3369 RepID=UPI0027D9F711|nr:uncharacterized protein LOC131068897 isoform X2 [Cryptomeria japonica]
METALFSPSSLFTNDEEDELSGSDSEKSQTNTFVEREHSFPGMALVVREFSFHEVNANMLWPGASIFAEWLIEHQNFLRDRRIIELGSGTGALAVFLKKSLHVDITTSDFEDNEIEENIAHNCIANRISVLPHIRHTWGEEFSTQNPDWDMIIASDILLYVKQYPNLINTLLFLLKKYTPVDKMPYTTKDQGSQIMPQDQHMVAELKENNYALKDQQQHGKSFQRGEAKEETDELPKPCFLMSWRRRIPKEDDTSFFNGCKNKGLMVQHLGSRVFCISLGESINF